MANIPQLYYLAHSDPPLNIVISLNTDFNQEPINCTYLYNAPTVTYYVNENSIQSHQLYKGLNTFTTGDMNDDLTIHWNGNNISSDDFDVQYLGQTLSPLPNSSQYSNYPSPTPSLTPRTPTPNRGSIPLANNTNPATNWWFWLLIIGIILIIGLIIFSVARHNKNLTNVNQVLASASPYSSLPNTTRLTTSRNVATYL